MLGVDLGKHKDSFKDLQTVMWRTEKTARHRWSKTNSLSVWV